MRNVASAFSFVTTRLRLLLVGLALVVPLVLVGEAAAAPESEEAKLTASDAAADDVFGGSVAVSGDTVVVGAENAGSFGSAYVFVRSGGTWSQQAILTASDLVDKDHFGFSVAISGDTAVVGSVAETSVSRSGSAYVFVRSAGTWTPQAKLTPPRRLTKCRIRMVRRHQRGHGGGERSARRRRGHRFRCSLRVCPKRHYLDPAGQAQSQRPRITGLFRNFRRHQRGHGGRGVLL